MPLGNPEVSVSYTVVSDASGGFSCVQEVIVSHELVDSLACRVQQLFQIAPDFTRFDTFRMFILGAYVQCAQILLLLSPQW